MGVPARRAQVGSLTKWREPKGIKEAEDGIRLLCRSMHQNAYLLGKTLLWAKKQLDHGKFIPWLEHNVKLFSGRTARRLMLYAVTCDEAGMLLEIYSGKLAILANSNNGWNFAEFSSRLSRIVEREAKRCPKEELPRLAYILRSIATELVGKETVE